MRGQLQRVTLIVFLVPYPAESRSPNHQQVVSLMLQVFES